MGPSNQGTVPLVVLLCTVFLGEASATKNDHLYKDPSQPVGVWDLLKRDELDDDHRRLARHTPEGMEGAIRAQQSQSGGMCDHFVGNGGTMGGQNEGNTVVSYEVLVNIHMKAYAEAIARGFSTVMASYSSWNGVKKHAKKFLLTNVLEEKLAGSRPHCDILVGQYQQLHRPCTPRRP